MTNKTTMTESENKAERIRIGEIIFNVFGVIVLSASIACPWVMWYAWGPWLGLAGIVLGQVLYLALLKPGGICLGLTWIFTAISGVFALLGIGAITLWRFIH